MYSTSPGRDGRDASPGRDGRDASPGREHLAEASLRVQMNSGAAIYYGLKG